MKKNLRFAAFLMVAIMLFSAGGCRKNPKSGDGSLSEYNSDFESGSGLIENPSGENSAASGTKSKAAAGSSSQTVNKNVPNFGGATVTMIFEWQPSDQKGIDASRDRELDRIADINKKYNVKLVMKKGASNYNEAIISSIAAGSPIGNIIRLSGNGNYDFIKAGLCAPLEKAIQQAGVNISSAQYNEAAMKYYNVNGSQYIINCIVPQENGGGNLLYYNKNILKELGYKDSYINDLCKSGAWDWNAAAALASQAKKVDSNGMVTRYGMGFEYAYGMTQDLIVANGGKIGSVAADGSPVCNFDTKQVREALNQLYQWSAVDKLVSATEGDSAISKFGKGEVFLFFGGDAKKFYNSGVSFGTVFQPKGPSASEHIIRGSGGGASYMIPVTYQKNASDYIFLLDRLYAPYPDQTRENIVKADQINYFSDSESWNYYYKAAFDKNVKHVNDPFSVFNLQWTDPAFATVCQNLVKGTLTGGTLVEKYNDQYQAVLDDLFKGYKLTNIK